MQDFSFGKIKAQETSMEPYTLYNKEQELPEPQPKDGTLRDYEYFYSMYPERVRGFQLVAETVCDEMDYEESPMYDEYPDRVFVDKMLRKMQVQVQENVSEETQNMVLQPAMQEMVEVYEVPSSAQPCYASVLTDGGAVPHVPYGPAVFVQTLIPLDKGYQTWEMNDGLLKAEQLMPPPSEWGPSSSRPWSPSPPRPWGPPPPPRPWGPPPPPRPWGPPPPPRPWGPPPSPRPWGPPSPPPHRPGDRVDLDDILRLLLFGEMQRRRCHRRNCR